MFTISELNELRQYLLVYILLTVSRRMFLIIMPKRRNCKQEKNEFRLTYGQRKRHN